jgi:hypothetical protein
MGVSAKVNSHPKCCVIVDRTKSHLVVCDKFRLTKIFRALTKRRKSISSPARIRGTGSAGGEVGGSDFLCVLARRVPPSIQQLYHWFFATPRETKLIDQSMFEPTKEDFTK